MNDSNHLDKLIGSAAGIAECAEHGKYEAMDRLGRSFGCPDCRRAAHDIAVRLGQAAIPARYIDASIDRLDAGPRRTIEAWVGDVAAGKPGALLILGPVGTGKTFAGCALAHLACTRRIQSVYASVPGYLRRLRESWDSRDITEQTVFDTVSKPRVLVLDEVGVGLKTDRDAQRVHELIDDRYGRRLPTVFITNLNRDGLRDALGDRAYDRIREDATQLSITGQSRRGPRTT